MDGFLLRGAGPLLPNTMSAIACFWIASRPGKGVRDKRYLTAVTESAGSRRWWARHPMAYKEVAYNLKGRSYTNLVKLADLQLWQDFPW